MVAQTFDQRKSQPNFDVHFLFLQSGGESIALKHILITIDHGHYCGRFFSFLSLLLPFLSLG